MQHTHARFLTALALTALSTMPALASAQTITNVAAINESSDDPVSEDREFFTQGQLFPVTNHGLTASFVHRMAFRNTHSAFGGVAQVNKRNVIFEVSFTVEDPNDHGFLIQIDEYMQGISGIHWEESGSGTALATGLSGLAEYDDSTDAADTFDPIGSLVGSGTAGVQISEPGSVAELHENSNRAVLGPYTGTTTFVIRFNSLFTSTTNVVFPNNTVGSGGVVYGLGPVPPGFEQVTADDLGHFFTITASFASPCTGDVTGDNAVDLQDLNLVLANFGTDSLSGDATLDGEVDLEDLNIVLASFGVNCDEN
ncbi:MAG: hypothetical protein ACIAQF_04365 [Phycisphaerales bacterium JB065]